MKAGDLIIKVDDTSLRGVSSTDAVKKCAVILVQR